MRMDNVTEKNMIKVLLVDDQNLVRQGVQALLDIADDIEVIGEARSGQEALELVKDNPRPAHLKSR